MSIATQITALQADKAAIATAITNKGGTVNPGDGFDDFAADIATIPSGSTQAKYGVTIDNMLGNIAANGVLQQPTEKFDLNFAGVEDVAKDALQQKFLTNNQIRSVKFPDLKQISGSDALYGTFDWSSIENIDLSSLETISGSNGMREICYRNSVLTKVNLSKLKTVSGNSGCYNAFAGASYTGEINNIDLSSLETVSGISGCSGMFTAQSNLPATFNSLPKLKTVSGTSAMNNFLQVNANRSNNITTFSFPILDTITGNSAMAYFFRNRTSLQHVYFNAIKTSSFGSNTNQFQNLITGITGCTIHFPSNMEETISGLTGYPNFGGTSTVLAYDLPATE